MMKALVVRYMNLGRQIRMKVVDIGEVYIGPRIRGGRSRRGGVVRDGIIEMDAVLAGLRSLNV